MGNLALLPDSRARRPLGAKQMSNGQWMIPIYCANCGKPQGMVTEECFTFVMFLCDPCNEKYGEIAGTMTVPDEVFYAKMYEAQLEKYGRPLDALELALAFEDPCNPLKLLLRERLGIPS